MPNVIEVSMCAAAVVESAADSNPQVPNTQLKRTECKVDQSELLTVPEAAERLRISKWMLYNLIRSRRLSTVKIGDRRLVPVAAIRTLLAELQEEAA